MLFAVFGTAFGMQLYVITTPDGYARRLES
jgi:hypothetical protein